MLKECIWDSGEVAIKGAVDPPRPRMVARENLFLIHKKFTNANQ